MKALYKPYSIIHYYYYHHHHHQTLLTNARFGFPMLEAYRFFAVSLGGLRGKLVLPGVICGLSGGTPIVSMIILTECVLPRRASLSTLSVTTWASSGVSDIICCSTKFLKGIHTDSEADSQRPKMKWSSFRRHEEKRGRRAASMWIHRLPSIVTALISILVLIHSNRNLKKCKNILLIYRLNSSQG